jgi:hypothetical protein
MLPSRSGQTMPDLHRAVPCTDAAGRPSDLGVLVEQDAVVLGLPPGESANLTVEQVVALRTVLGDALHEFRRTS